MFIKYLFILLLLVATLLVVNQSIKRYTESEVCFLRTQLKLLEVLDILLQVYPEIDTYITQLPIIKDTVNKKLAIYKPLSQYGLLTLFYS